MTQIMGAQLLTLFVSFAKTNPLIYVQKQKKTDLSIGSVTLPGTDGSHRERPLPTI